MRHMDYIHFNPVKHGYCSRVDGWPYSTFHRYVEQGVYPLDWGVTELMPIWMRMNKCSCIPTRRVGMRILGWF